MKLLAKQSWLLTVLLASMLTLVRAAAVIEGVVVANGTLDIGAYAELSTTNARSHRGDIGISGQFSFEDVPAGEYGLNVRSRLYSFQTYAIKVSDEGDVTASLYVPGRGAIPGMEIRTPLRIPAVAPKIYGDRSAPFSLVRLVKSNPTILMLVIGGLAAVALPALLQMLDPEIAQEVQQNQREMHNKLANFQSIDGISKMLSSATTAESGSGSGAASPGQGSKAKKRRK